MKAPSPRSDSAPAPHAIAPFLVILTGLPGAGKSTVARDLCRRLHAVRAAIFPHPARSPQEHRAVFARVHRMMRRGLAVGYPVVMDATNLTARHRALARAIAADARVPAYLVRVHAPAPVVRDRLALRPPTEAGWPVYLRMAATAEPIAGPHWELDTSKQIAVPLGRLIAAIRRASSTPNRARRA